MSYCLADVLAVNLDDFTLQDIPADDIPKEADAAHCEYVFGYSVAAHDWDGGNLVVITDNEEEGGGDQCRLVQGNAAAYCAAFVLNLAADAASQSAELFLSNSVAQNLYEEMQAQGDEPVTVLYRSAITFQAKSLGEFANRAEAEAAVAEQKPAALTIGYWARRYLAVDTYA